MSIKNEMSQYLGTIYSYYVSSEVEVKRAVEFILKKLKETNDIPYEEYGKLANYLIAIKDDLKCDSVVDECKEIMLSKITNVSDKTRDRIIFHSGIELESDKQKLHLGIFSYKQEL